MQKIERLTIHHKDNISSSPKPSNVVKHDSTEINEYLEAGWDIGEWHIVFNPNTNTFNDYIIFTYSDDEEDDEYPESIGPMLDSLNFN